MILRFLILLNVLCITFSLTYAHTGKRHVEKQNIDIQESNEESASIFLKKLLSFKSVEEENLQEPQIFLQKEEVEPEHEEAAALADSLENESNQSNYASETLDSEPQSALAQSESPISKDKLEPTSFLRFENATLPTGRAVRITSPYGIRSYRMHKGIDVKVYKGDSILAAFSGRVVKAAYERRGYGHYIVLEHDNGTRTVYAHLSKRLVKYGEKVYSGQLIGKGGNTGRSTGSHLHFEITYKKMPIDPSLVFDFAEGTVLANNTEIAISELESDYDIIQSELSKYRIYRVKKGDTLGKIARMYGISVQRLCKLNGIKRNSVLRIGQRLRCS